MFFYKKDGRFNCSQLRVKDEIDELSELEIIKQNYEALWLDWGQYEKMSEIVAKHKLSLKYLNVYCWEKQSVTWINSLTALEYLQVDGIYKGMIDFDALPNLTAVEIELNKSTQGILNSSGNISSLSLNKFKGTLHDFDHNTAKNIKTLGLEGGSLTSLEGIDKFINLKELCLSRLTKLTNIGALAKCQKLEHLNIDSCNKIENYEVFGSLSTLRELLFSNKELPSLSIIPKETIEKVILGERTLILDENVETFFEFPKLKRAVFRNKRGYKYGAIEINEMLALQKSDKKANRP